MLFSTDMAQSHRGRAQAWGTVRRIASALGVEVSELASLAEEIEDTQHAL